MELAHGIMYFEGSNPGDSWTSAEHTVNHEEMLAYGRTNDPWPFHVNPEAATISPFGGLIASGGYTITLMYRLSHEIVNQPDRTWAFLGGFDWHLKFLDLFVQVTGCTNALQFWEKRLSSKPGRGIVKHLIELIDDRKRMVLSIESTCRPLASSNEQSVTENLRSAMLWQPQVTRRPRDLPLKKRHKWNDLESCPINEE